MSEESSSRLPNPTTLARSNLQYVNELLDRATDADPLVLASIHAQLGIGWAVLANAEYVDDLYGPLKEIAGHLDEFPSAIGHALPDLSGELRGIQEILRLSS